MDAVIPFLVGMCYRVFYPKIMLKGWKMQENFHNSTMIDRIKVNMQYFIRYMGYLEEQKEDL